MTHWPTYISKGKRPVLALLLSAGLSLGGIASAQGQSLLMGQEDPELAVAFQEHYGLQHKAWFQIPVWKVSGDRVQRPPRRQSQHSLALFCGMREMSGREVAINPVMEMPS